MSPLEEVSKPPSVASVPHPGESMTLMVPYLTEECRFAVVVVVAAAAAAAAVVVTEASVWGDSNHLQNRSKSQHPPRKQP